MTPENDTRRDSAYTRTYTAPVARDIMAVALTPGPDTLESMRELVAVVLEQAYRAGQATAPCARGWRIDVSKFQRERVLLRRAIGIVSDLQRLEGSVREVLDAYAAIPSFGPESDGSEESKGVGHSTGGVPPLGAELAVLRNLAEVVGDFLGPHGRYPSDLYNAFAAWKGAFPR